MGEGGFGLGGSGERGGGGEGGRGEVGGSGDGGGEARGQTSAKQSIVRTEYSAIHSDDLRSRQESASANNQVQASHRHVDGFSWCLDRARAAPQTRREAHPR